MAIYSHSKLQSFEQCKYKYLLRYIYKIRPEIEASIEAVLGTCAHDALEWLYNEVKNGRLPNLDDVLEVYTAKWQAKYNERVIIVKSQFSSGDYYNKGIKFILDYYLKHTPFQDGTIAMEKKVWVTLEQDSPHKIMGYIDRLVFNKEKNAYEVHDYKTANYLPNQKKLDEDRQLALYSIAIKELYGQDKDVILTWHYLSHNKQVFSYRTDEQLEQLKVDIIDLINEIEETTEFPTTKMVLCDWCEYKSMCKAHGNCIPDEHAEAVRRERLKQIQREALRKKEREQTTLDF